MAAVVQPGQLVLRRELFELQRLVPQRRGSLVHQALQLEPHFGEALERQHQCREHREQQHEDRHLHARPDDRYQDRGQASHQLRDGVEQAERAARRLATCAHQRNDPAFVDALHRDQHQHDLAEGHGVETGQRHRPRKLDVQRSRNENRQRHQARIGECRIADLAQRYAAAQPVPRIQQRRQAIDPGRGHGPEHQDARDLGHAVEGDVAEHRVGIPDRNREHAEDKEEQGMRPVDLGDIVARGGQRKRSDGGRKQQCAEQELARAQPGLGRAGLRIIHGGQPR